MAICSRVFTEARSRGSVAPAKVSAQSPPCNRNASPRATAASRSRSIRTSSGTTSGGSVDSAPATSRSRSASGHRGCCRAGSDRQASRSVVLRSLTAFRVVAAPRPPPWAGRRGAARRGAIRPPCVGRRPGPTRPPVGRRGPKGHSCRGGRHRMAQPAGRRTTLTRTGLGSVGRDVDGGQGRSGHRDGGPGAGRRGDDLDPGRRRGVLRGAREPRGDHPRRRDRAGGRVPPAAGRHRLPDLTRVRLGEGTPMPTYGVIGIAAVAAILFIVIVFKATWRVAEPNEALIISGLGARSASPDTADSLGFKIITGKGAVVLPGFQTARRLVLDSRATQLEVSCVTKQGIPVHVRGVVIYKIGDDFASIANAARRFLDQQAQMDDKTHTLFAGHLRSIVGSLTVEEMIHNREALTSAVRQSSSVEMSKLGLVVDSLQIQEIEDTAGYVQNLGKPHAAAVAAAARIAEAQRDQEATEAEQIANANKAAASRDSQLKQASFQAEIDQANAQAKQAGPLAEATSRQEVVVQETRAAELEAELSEQRLQSQVRKPADAKAYEQRTLAESDRDARISRAQADARETELRASADATRVKTAAIAEAEATKARGEATAFATRANGEAEAAATQARGLAQAQSNKARGLAEADAIKARAQALAENQEAVVAQQLAERWPEIVAAGATAFGNVDHMVVLNGADGVSELFAKALTLGGTGLGLARNLLEAMKQTEPAPNGAAPNRPES